MFSSNDPFLQYTHNPNCSAITDDELAGTVHGVWPSSNGNATINYIFSLPAYWWLYANPFEYHLRNLDAQTVDVFTAAVRYVVSKIQSSNDGILTFKEIARSFKTDYSPFFRGIYYAQTASEAQFTDDDSGAFTYIQFDNNGYIKRALVHLPTDYNIYNDSQNIYQPFWDLYAICHESYHALGGEHLQDFPEILAQLQTTVDGVFCSVMDYPSIVGTDTSNCYQNCTPQFAALPGPLDIRSVQLAYLQGKYDLGFDKGSYYFFNALELCLFFAFISTAYALVYNALTALLARENKYFSKNTIKNYVELTLNIALVGLLAEMETPDVVTILFSLSTGLKLIPDSLLTKIRGCGPGTRLQRVSRWKYPLFVLGFTASFSEGKVLLAIFLMLGMSLSTIFLGNLLGKLLMMLLIFVASKSFNAAWEKLFPTEELPQDANAFADGIEIELMAPNDRRLVNNQALSIALIDAEEKPYTDNLRIVVPAPARHFDIAIEAAGDEERYYSPRSGATTPDTPTTISVLSSPRTPSTPTTIQSPRSPLSPWWSPKSASSRRSPSITQRYSVMPRAISGPPAQHEEKPVALSVPMPAIQPSATLTPRSSAANFRFYRNKDEFKHAVDLKQSLLQTTPRFQF